MGGIHRLKGFSEAIHDRLYFPKFVILGSTWRGKFVIVSEVEKPVRLLK